MGQIALNGIKYHGGHGYYSEEKKIQNHFIIDIKIDYPIEQIKDDDLEKTINYEELHGIVLDVMNSNVDLIETLANQIGRRILNIHKDILRSEVTIRKKNPPLKGEVKESAVTSMFTK